ncbi:alpha/beta fold hydrolase [Flavobacterium sp. CGRL2]
MENILYKNTKISFTDSGKGNTVVFLHGFLENKKMWTEYAAFFSEKYRVVTIDLLGHGESDSLGYVHEMEENAQAVNEVFRNILKN